MSTPGRQDLRSCLSGGPERKKSFWSSKRGETFRPSARSSTGRLGRGRKFRPWFRQGPSKLRISTRPLKKKRLCLPCAWHWADRYLTGPACRIREHAEAARCIRCIGYGHGSQGCYNLDRQNACRRCGATGHLARSCKATPRYLTCLDKGDKGIAHVSGGSSCPVFREELWRLRGRN